MVAQADFKPEEVVAAQIEASLPGVGYAAGLWVVGENIVVGDRRGWDLLPGGVPDYVIFVMASGGSPSRPIKDGITDEKKVRLDVQVRGNKSTVANAFRDSQQLARDIHFIVDQKPPTGWCELRALNSLPSFLERDTDGHPWFGIGLNGTVDVVP